MFQKTTLLCIPPRFPLFNQEPNRYIGDKWIDHDKIGIVYVYGDTCFVVYEVWNGEKGKKKKKEVECGTLPWGLLGQDLQDDWLIFPLLKIGARGWGVPMEAWLERPPNLLMKSLRLRCTTVALEAETLRRTYHFTEQQHCEGLQRALMDCVHDFYSTEEAVKVSQLEKSTEAQKVISTRSFFPRTETEQHQRLPHSGHGPARREQEVYEQEIGWLRQQVVDLRNRHFQELDNFQAESDKLKAQLQTQNSALEAENVKLKADLQRCQ